MECEQVLAGWVLRMTKRFGGRVRHRALGSEHPMGWLAALYYTRTRSLNYDEYIIFNEDDVWRALQWEAGDWPAWAVEPGEAG